MKTFLVFFGEDAPVESDNDADEQSRFFRLNYNRLDRLTRIYGKGFDKNMKYEKIKNTLFKTGFASLMLGGFLFLFAADTHAQYRRNDRYNTRVERLESRNIVRIAESQGYSDGLREGTEALRQRKRYNPYGEGKYRKGMNGYQSRLGSKSTYKRFYQQAFVRGYNEAYNRGNRPVRRGW